MSDEVTSEPTNEVPRIGERIRARRQVLKISIRELARRTDLTASFLSQVEHNRTNTSIGSLRRIAEALGVSMMEFLEDRPRPMPVVRANQRSKLSLPNSKVSYELLVPDLTHKMEVFLGRFEPGAGNVVRSPLREPTEECIFILSGSLLVGLGGDEYVLNQGDSIYFDGDDLTKIQSASDEETVFISVITPPVF